MKKTNTDHLRPSRRDFNRIMAGALIVLPLATSAFVAQIPAPSPNPTPAPTETPSALTLALMAVAKARFGEYLSTEQQAKLLDGLGGLPATAERLRGVKLKNSDEPDFVFSA